MGWPLLFQVLNVLQVKARCALGQDKTVGYWWLGQWAFGALPLLPFHYLPYPTREGFLLFFSMVYRPHIIVGHPTVPQELLLVPLSIPPEAAVEPVHPK